MTHRAPRLPKKVRTMIFHCFVDDKNAVTTTTDVGRAFYKQTGDWKREPWHASFHITVLRYFKRFRQAIRDHELVAYPRLEGEIEVNLAYFGAHLRRKKEEDLAVRKLLGIKPPGKPVAYRTTRRKKYFERPVLGILQRGGPVVLLPVESRARPFLELMLRQIVARGSIVYTDREKGLGEISLLGFKHRAVTHAAHYVDHKGWHINGIESVFRIMKEAMRTKFKGVPRSTLDLHIKEREFRHNHRDDLARALKAILK